MEGVDFKKLNEPYRPAARGWLKYKVRETAEAIVGLSAAPRTLLLGSYDDHQRLQYIGRNTTLPRNARSRVSELLTFSRPGHPWTGWSFSAGWGSQDTLDVTLVEPDLVVEVGADIARDTAGRWRHPARWHRPRTDLTPTDIPHTTTAT